jgi:hypothetical protein
VIAIAIGEYNLPMYFFFDIPFKGGRASRILGPGISGVNDNAEAAPAVSFSLLGRCDFEPVCIAESAEAEPAVSLTLPVRH